MYRLRAIIDNLTTRKVNKDIEVKENKVFVEKDKKYEFGNWYVKVDDVWNALQGGVPVYESAEDIDDDIFEETDKPVEEENV